MVKEHTTFRKKSECIKLPYFPATKIALSFEAVTQWNQAVDLPPSTVCAGRWVGCFGLSWFKEELQPQSM